MQHSKFVRDIWTNQNWHGLMGDFGRPIVPLWWAEALGPISFNISYMRKKSHLVEIRSIWQEIDSPLLTNPNVQIKYENTLENLGALIESVRNDFLDAPIGDSEIFIESELVGRQLPVLVSYASKFDALGIGEKPIAQIASIPIQYFLENNFTWLEICDISYILSHGISCGMGILAAFDNCTIKTLEDCTTHFMDELRVRDGHRLDLERMSNMQRRLGIGCDVETLDTIGYDMGISRERVRQLESRLNGFVGKRRWPMPAQVNEILEKIRDEDSGSVLDDLRTFGYSDGTKKWTRDMLDILMWAYGQHELCNEFYFFGRPIEVSSDLAAAIKKQRNRMGFFDLRTFLRTDNEFEKPDRFFAQLEKVYSLLFRSGDFVLAGDARGTQAQRAVAKQFAVASQLSGEELLDGIDRVRRNRNYPALPPRSVVLDLLEQAGTIRKVGPELFEGEAAEIEGELKLFLINSIRDAPGGVANQPELFRAAVVEGHNTSSLVLYLTYEPTVRKLEGGLMRLAGNYPSQSAIDDAKRAAELQTTQGSVDYSVLVDGTISVTCVLGTSNLNSGVLSSSAALRGILDPGGYAIKCCDESNFNGRISISNSFWYGYQPLFNHLRLDHGVKDGDLLKFDLTGGLMSVDEIVKIS